VTEALEPPYCSVKACVFPFSKFPGVDTILGPEMKSTGEVMGIHTDFAGGFAKSQYASNNRLPTEGKVFLSVMDKDKAELPEIARELASMNFSLVATRGTAAFLSELGLKIEVVNKVREGSPHVVDMLGRGEIAMVINTPEGSGSTLDSRSIRLVANELVVPTFTTMAAAQAAVKAINIIRQNKHINVKALQDYHQQLSGSGVQRKAG
jgi:carbamoyl-phosphate synthase large subunit